MSADDGPESFWRVIHTRESGADIVSQESDDAWPEPISADTIRSRNWREVEDPWLALRATHDDDVPELHIQWRDRANAELEFLRVAGSAPAGETRSQLLDAKTRRRLIKEIAAQRKIQRNTLRRWLQKYWVRGATKNALLADSTAMSGAGNTREIPAEACDADGNPLDPNLYSKIGRANVNGTREGIRMTEPIRKSIEGLGVKLYLDNPKNTISDTYVKWKAAKKDINPARYPTPQAFAWYLTQNPKVATEVKKRGFGGAKPRGKAAINDAMHTRVPGPGFCYQGDSTPLPRIRVNGQRITLYFCSDTATSAIVGYYAYAGNPSAEAHSRCLANAVTDKVPYCLRYGIKITNLQFPMAHVPDAWVADRGELIGPIADILVSSFHINLHNTPAYSPQLKADVEAGIGQFMRELIAKLDNHVAPRPGRKWDDTIELTMHELHVFIILFILAYNSRKLDQVPSPSQVRRGVWMTPLGMWNKEFELLNGEGRKFSSHELLLVTTKRSEAKLDRTGILFGGLTYVCREPEMAGYLANLGERTKTFFAQHDEDATARLFVQRKALARIGLKTTGAPYEFIECQIHPKNEAWKDYSFPDYRAAYKKHSEETQDLYNESDRTRAALGSAIEEKNNGATTVVESQSEASAANADHASSPASEAPPHKEPATDAPTTSGEPASPTIGEDSPFDANTFAALQRARKKPSNNL